MKITTKRKLRRIAERMARGIRLASSEKQLLRDSATEVQEPDFKALLQNAGNETTLRLLRQAGKDLLNKLRFATGARRKDDLSSDNPGPVKVKRWLKQGKLPK